jgi:cell volume regulation protein A
MHIGWHRFWAATAPIVVVGVAGAFFTAAAGACTAARRIRVGLVCRVVVAAAVAATDPAVVLSVLGQREIAGRSSTLLEGESGANDPVSR